MPKRLLFIEDLYDFYSNTYKRSTHFDAEKSGSPIVVQVHGKVKFEKNDKDTEGLLPVHLQACHTNLNINGSNISEDVMTSALPSFSNRPILGYIHSVNGHDEFYAHNMHEDDKGNIVYDEVPVGIIPESCNAQLVYDKDKKKTYCEVNGYIFEEYSKAAEILQREEECSVSVELSIRSLSYNAKEKYLDIEDFFFSGVTILGKTPDGETVMPGMEKSNIKLADFSTNNNSLFTKYENQMIEFQERLEKLESTCINKYNSEKGGDDQNMKLEELLKKYNKTIEDITFDYKDLSDDELTAKFTEVFEDGDSSDGANEAGEDNTDTSEGDGTDESGNDTPTDDTEEDKTDDTTSDDDTSDISSSGTDDEELKKKQNNSVNTDKLVRTYEISHEDTRYALYQLLEEFEFADNEWYFINSVFDTYFTYENWNGDKIFGQSYTKDGDNVAFDGERYNLHRELLTDSEFAELQSMRSNYTALKEFKETAEKNELHAQKEEILNSEKYAVLAEKDEFGEYTNKAFAKLVSEMDSYSLADLETQVKVIHSDYIAEHSNFSANKDEKKKTTSVKMFANPSNNTKESRYGNLFSKKNKNK